MLGYKETVEKAKARAAEIAKIEDPVEREAATIADTSELYGMYAEGKIDDDTYFIALNQYT